MASTMESFVSKTVALLQLERDAEIEETRVLQENFPLKELQRRGVCLLKLQIASRHTGLYGRNVVVFQPYWAGKELPAHKFTSGDIAGLSLSKGDTDQELLTSGIVSKVSQSTISVAFEDSLEQLDLDEGAQYRLNKLANDVTYKRLKKALEELNTYRSGRSSQLINVLFGDSDVSPPYSSARDGTHAPPGELDIKYFNPDLDESQKEAVRFALNQREMAIIHGPPGTGKTTTVVEVILQAVQQNLKVLACAPSNIAVDNMVEKLSRAKVKVVRMGHPARVLPGVQKHSLDAILATSHETKLVEDVRKDMDKTLGKMRKSRDKGERQQLKQDMKHLRKELRQREDAAVKEILTRAQVVMATLTGASRDGPLKQLQAEHFDLIVIDECSQALEAACWIALLRGPKCVLAGDHHQLPPTIISHKAAADGLSLTLMERLLQLHGSDVVKMLTMQYRMNSLIMEWSSKQLYDNKLLAHHTVENHLLRDLDGVVDDDDTSLPLLLIDTTGCQLYELNVPDEVSKGNEDEADLVTVHVDNLISKGVSPEDIAVIAPYNLQVELLRLRLSQKYPKLEIKSVDGFQGREKEAVVISLVRSNDSGEVGFLAEDRRINVAITRARRHLAVICDGETVSHHAFLKSLVEYMMEKGEVRSAQQYIEDGALKNDCPRPEFLETQMESQRPTSNKTSVVKKADRKKKTARGGPDGPSRKDDVRSDPHSQSIKEPTQKREPFDFDKNRDQVPDYVITPITDLAADSSVTEYIFPPSLNSYDRMMVHEVAERLGLLHISRGDGTERHIVVSKKSTQTEQRDTETRDEDHPEGKVKGQYCSSDKEDKTSSDLETNIHPDNIDHKPISKETDDDIDVTLQTDISTQAQMKHPVTDINLSKCRWCQKVIPQANKLLHELRCHSRPEAQQVHPKDPNPQTKKKKSKRKVTTNRSPVEEDDDALLAAAITQNTTCCFSKCKTNVKTLGQHCAFCTKRFCLSHHIPEVHGCGDLAKAHARHVIARDGVLYMGSGVPDKKPKPEKRVHLERKLNKKLEDLTDKRKHKKKEK